MVRATVVLPSAVLSQSRGSYGLLSGADPHALGDLARGAGLARVRDEDWHGCSLLGQAACRRVCGRPARSAAARSGAARFLTPVPAAPRSREPAPSRKPKS